LVWIPSTQQSNPEKESYDKKAVPVVAYSTDKTLHFKNAAALLKCQVNQASATRIRFYGLNDEVVAGRALAAMKENGEMDYVGIPEDEWNEHSVELSDASGGALRSSWNYYISIIPNTFASGFGIELLNAEGEVVFTKQYDKSITIERNTILDLGTLGGSSDIEPSDGDYIDEYGINHGPGVEINGVVWAPVNCGYHAEDFKYGKLYQWGRKYGQGYINNFFQDALAPVVKEGPVSLAEGQAAENENVFFNLDINKLLYNQYPKWSIGVQSRLWNYGTEQNPIKTEYDPCPDGWRVPTSVESALLESCTYSWVNESHPEFNGIYGSIVVGASGLGETFFPAAGYIAYGDGFGLNRGGGFFYYNSNLSDLTGAAEVYMVAESYYTRNEASAFGMSVRCVSDEYPLIKVESLTIDKTSLNMNQGEACTISAEVAPADANQSSALWYSDTPSVATVDENGKVTAVSVGTARIIAMAGMKSAECVVTVKESPFIGTWKGTMSGYYRQAIYQDVTFTVAADPEGGLTVSAGINPYFIINGIEGAVYRAEIEGNQLVVSSQQQVGYDDVILVGFNHADPAAATEYDHIRFIMNEDGTLSQPYAFGAYTESGGGWYEIYPGGGTFKKEYLNLVKFV
ncbi:MAG: Ig-like domain-containing protein, partial [Bacteroidales bacterium]|nr:Ig-like domain-containing protein [Bacteroidales bacterium]